jgi:hypothetical protein
MSPANPQMQAAPGAFGRFEAWLLSSQAGAIAIALAFLAFATTRGLAYLNDEGLLPFEYLQGFHSEPLAFFFMSKGKPVLQTLYALPALAGLQGYLIAHGIVGAIGVWLISQAARRFGIGRPNLAGWFLATSTIFAVSAANGIPNSDGAAFFALFLLLYASDRRIAAGVVLGMLPLVRHELGVITVTFAAWDVLRRRRLDMALAVGAFPAAYVLAGALYHRDLFWVFSLWVNPTEIPPELKDWKTLTILDALRYHVLAFPNNSPFLGAWSLAGIFLVLRRRQWPLLVLPIAMLLSAAAFASMQTGTSVAALDLRLRAYLLLAPPMAVLAAFGLSFALQRREAAWLRVTAISLALAWQALMVHDPQDVLGDQHRRVHALFDELRARGLYTGQPLYTDLQTARYDRCAGVATERTFLLANQAMRWEIQRNSTVESGQRAAALRGFEAARFLFEPERHAIRKDALYLLRRQPRVAIWRERVEAAGPSRATVGEWDAYWWPGNDSAPANAASAP